MISNIKNKQPKVRKTKKGGDPNALGEAWGNITKSTGEAFNNVGKVVNDITKDTPASAIVLRAIENPDVMDAFVNALLSSSKFNDALASMFEEKIKVIRRPSPQQQQWQNVDNSQQQMGYPTAMGYPQSTIQGGKKTTKKSK